MGWTPKRLFGHKQDMPLLVLASTMFFPAPEARASGVTGVEATAERIVVRFDAPVRNAQTFLIGGPDRLAIDVAGSDSKAHAPKAAGPVANVRQSQFSADTTRIVFDLARPVLISSGRFSADGKTLTLGLRPVDAPLFTSAAKASRKTYLPPVAQRAAPPKSRYNVTVPLQRTTSGLPRPKIYGPAGRPLVVIDAGHGGHDPGAISPLTGVREKDITLAIATKIKDELIASGRVRVAMVREDDRFYVLNERTAIARNIGAGLFISIHADSAGASEASGATIYTLSETASDREAAALAARENKADIINGVNLAGENKEIASILLDLAQRETMNSSAGFAKLLKREGAGLIPFRAGFHKMAGFAVLKAPDTPAVLLETGFMTNADDVRRISAPEGQKRIAEGVRKAVEIFFAKRMAQR